MKFIVLIIILFITTTVQVFHIARYLSGIDDTIKTILINVQQYNNETSENGELLLGKLEEFFDKFVLFYEQVKAHKVRLNGLAMLSNTASLFPQMKF